MMNVLYHAACVAPNNRCFCCKRLCNRSRVILNAPGKHHYHVHGGENLADLLVRIRDAPDEVWLVASQLLHVLVAGIFMRIAGTERAIAAPEACQVRAADELVEATERGVE